MDKILISYVVSALVGYLLGSVPFALLIGKIFYNTDIRQHGSGNLGGANTGRVLGKKAGLAVMTLDILKVTLAMFIASLLAEGEISFMISGLSCALGHCFPVFARFRGGKAVATMYGFLFGMTVVAHRSILLFVVPLAAFLFIIFTTRVVAVSSIGSSLAAVVYAGFFENSIPLTVTLAIFSLIMILRHRANIQRLIKGEENKVRWIRK